MFYTCKKNENNLSKDQSSLVKLEDDTVIQIRNVRLIVNGRLLPLMMQTKLLISIKNSQKATANV